MSSRYVQSLRYAIIVKLLLSSPASPTHPQPYSGSISLPFYLYLSTSPTQTTTLPARNAASLQGPKLPSPRAVFQLGPQPAAPSLPLPLPTSPSQDPTTNHPVQCPQNLMPQALHLQTGSDPKPKREKPPAKCRGLLQPKGSYRNRQPGRKGYCPSMRTPSIPIALSYSPCTVTIRPTIRTDAGCVSASFARHDCLTVLFSQN
ncbi:hypothetical protein ES703_54112 [subsurface metagenome]